MHFKIHQKYKIVTHFYGTVTFHYLSSGEQTIAEHKDGMVKRRQKEGSTIVCGCLKWKQLLMTDNAKDSADGSTKICALIQFSAAALWPLTVCVFGWKKHASLMWHFWRGAFRDVAWKRSPLKQTKTSPRLIKSRWCLKTCLVFDSDCKRELAGDTWARLNVLDIFTDRHLTLKD